jgi:hypothetical protein
MKIGKTEYLTVKDFAKAKGCSLKTAYNWINAGEDSDGYKIEWDRILEKTLVNIDLYKGKLNS